MPAWRHPYKGDFSIELRIYVVLLMNGILVCLSIDLLVGQDKAAVDVAYDEVALMNNNELVESLTSCGEIPIGLFFAYDGLVYRWHPEMRMVLVYSHDNHEQGLRFVNYLISINQYCSKVEDIKDLANRLAWPNWTDGPP
jgi:hypothetical protein